MIFFNLHHAPLILILCLLLQAAPSIHSFLHPTSPIPHTAVPISLSSNPESSFQSSPSTPASAASCSAFSTHSANSSPLTSHLTRIPRQQHIIRLYANNNDKQDKFSFQQRIESVKTAAVGAIAGGIAATPFIFLHDVILSSSSFVGSAGLSSWEFDTDMGSLQSALFAIVYRYCVREEDDNDMLNMGVVGAFVLVRTLSRVGVPRYCTAAPLYCGEPLGYFDWDMIWQVGLNGLESAALFGGAAAAMEYAYGKGWISKFPN